jgi:hypothetical protein
MYFRVQENIPSRPYQGKKEYAAMVAASLVVS